MGLELFYNSPELLENSPVALTAIQIDGAVLAPADPLLLKDRTLPPEPKTVDAPSRNASGVQRFFTQMLRDTYSIFQLGIAPREALSLMNARSDTTLSRFVAEPGRVLALAAQPFVSAEWSSAVRMRHMIEHCAIIDDLGHPFDIHGDQYVEVVSFDLDGEHCRLTLDRPTWLDSDGMLCVSLWAGPDRIMSISFCLSDCPIGRTAYIGGIQGRRSEQALDQNRAMTKAAFGLRPRDLSLELFRMLTPYLGITQIKGVADASRYQLTKRLMLRIGANDKVLLDYDDIWESRGGVRVDGGFFLIPVATSRRDADDIPAKKRCMYKRRYALLDEIEADIASAFRQKMIVRNHAAGV